MPRLTASDRSALIRLASSLPKGDEVRSVILTAAWDADIPDAWWSARDDMADMKENVLRVKKALDGFDREMKELGDLYESGILPFKVEEELEAFMKAYATLRKETGRASR